MPPSDPHARKRLCAALRSPRLALAVAVLLALAAFQLVFGVGLLRADAAVWSNPFGDMGQMVAGELAGLRAPWSLPLLTPDTLTWPDRTALVYTDSIPWLTALLKLTHLGRTFSLLGTFLLLSWLAQPVAMFMLLRACGVRRVATLLAGSLLAVMTPAWLVRQLGHTALSGHALLIFALALSVHASRTGATARLLAAFVALGVLATGIHAYHLPPITLLLLVVLASDALQRRPRALLRAAVALPVYLGAVLLAAWALGYFVGRAQSGGVGALGFYEMNLLGPVWPQASALAGQRWTGAWFTHPFDPSGGEYYEGFSYLGAGILLAVAAAVVLLRQGRGTQPVGTPRVSAWRRWGPLYAALALLTLWAVGPNGWLGPWQVWSAPLPNTPWLEPLALFRGQGRFAWTATYALIAGVLTVLDRAAIASWVRGGLLLVVSALQAADASQLLVALHDRFSRPEDLRVPVAFTGPTFVGRAFAIYPDYFCTASWLNQLTVRQLSLIAQRNHAHTTSAETARGRPGICARPIPADAQVDAAPDDSRITVVMGSEVGASGLTERFSRRGDCYAYGVVWFCGRNLAGVPGLTPADGRSMLAPRHLDATISFAAGRPNPALLSGWSKPEVTGVWSNAPRAVLRLPRPELPPGTGLTVTLQALSFQPRGRPLQRAIVTVGGRTLAAWRVESGGYHGYRVDVPAALLRPGGPLELVLDLPDAVIPESVQPGSGDYRLLGIGLREASVAH